MTLDVTIGKVVVDSDEDSGRAWASVEGCPVADFDVSPVATSVTPRESYRSGSTSFQEFWRKNDVLGNLYEHMRDHLDTDDRDVTYLAKYIEKINQLSPVSFDSDVDRDRLHWLQYWVNKALELYGKDAGIMFS